MAHKKVWQEISIFDMVRFVHQKVAVHVHDNREFVGWVYTVDPVTQSVVLYLNGYMTTVLGHAISKITILESPTPEIKKILGSLLDDEPKHGGQWLEQRKSRLAQWLHDNRFPVRMERERIIVANVLEIAPPYSVNSCHTSNEIILGRIQRLIDTMPE